MRSLSILGACVLAVTSVAGGSGTPGSSRTTPDSTPRLSLRPAGPSLRGQKLWAQRQHDALLPQSAAEPETLRVLALRVSFLPDQSDLTTGNGSFDLSQPAEAVIDSPPHNRLYFEHQLRAVANYYQKVSNGRVVILGDVFPQQSDASYELPQEMNYYGPEGSEDLVDQRLAELFRDGLLAADSDADLDFSRYDAYAVFHAGVGRDFGFEFDATPNDIPSAFLDSGTLGRALGVDSMFDGIPVDDGNVRVREGIILPEQQSQEDFMIGLLGTAVLMFGHQIGLPNLFDTETGRPGIGSWGMMDQGSGNFMGLLPAEPCAWSKVFMGWEIPILLRHGENLPLPSSLANTAGPRIYKIPISRDEYFLVENRQRDINNDGIAVGRDAGGARVEFKRNERGDQILAEGAIGVITQVDEYDYGLPGSGLLIWHIDDAVVRRDFESNRVNADPSHRGVDLEEADGAQDIGQVYGFLDPGAGAENGVPEDAFWGSNEINLLVNDTTVVAFTPTSYPDSRSNSGANSRVVITNISESSPTMTFDVRSELAQPGFPQRTVEQLQRQSLTVADVDNDGSPEVFLATTGVRFEPASTTPGGVTTSGPGKLLAWLADGSPLVAGEDSLAVLTSLGETEASSTAPVILDLNGDGRLDIVIGTAGRSGTASRVVAISTEDSEGAAVELWAVPMDNPISALVGLGDGTVVAADSVGAVSRIGPDGSVLWKVTPSTGSPAGMIPLPSGDVAICFTIGNVVAISAAGELRWQRNLGQTLAAPPVFGQLSATGSDVLVTVAVNGTVFANTLSGDPLAGFPVRPAGSTAATIESAPAVADINADGFNEIVFAADGRVFAVSSNGTLVDGFPSRRPASFGDMPQRMSAPVIGDIDGDGKPEVLVGSEEGMLLAVDPSGAVVTGFPFAVGSQFLSVAALTDLDLDGDIELLVAGDDGILTAYDLPGKTATEAQPWPMYQHDLLRTGHAEAPSEGSQPAAGLLVPGSVYNYPNPTMGNYTQIRYRLSADAVVRVKIYDLAGELVREIDGPGLGSRDNETTWELRDVQSGVYLARVEAKGASSTEVAVVKIAVVK